MVGSRVLLMVTAVFALFLAGCETKTASDTSMTTPTKAVVISGNGGNVAVFIPSADGKGAEMLSSSGEAICPDCQAAAANYFLTGHLVEKCPTCGATRTAVTLRVPAGGHN